MGRFGNTVRCLTSRKVCFPLIFTIATVSMITSIMELSYDGFPTWRKKAVIRAEGAAQHERVQLTTQARKFIELWEEWDPEQDIDLNARIQNKRDVGQKEIKQGRSDARKGKNGVNDQAKKKITNKLTNGVTEKHNAQGNDETGIYAENYPDSAVNYANEVLEDILNTSASKEKEKRKKLELLPEQTKGVIIVTSYRSGSSFLGQLFNQHSQAFYTFEPLFPFGSSCTFEVPRRIGLLRDMMKCKFPEMKSLYDALGVDWGKTSIDKGCVLNNFCFRNNHNELCTKDVCRQGNSPMPCYQCPPVDLSIVKNKCRSRKISAIKVIRLCDVLDLEPIIHDPSIDFKVIHLIRDPRGIASSRLKIHSKWDVSEQVVSTCLRQIHNVRAGRTVGWLKDRYKVVRYEDISKNPMASSKDIYDFVGLPFESKVKEWIQQNTRASEPGQQNFNDIRSNLLGVNSTYNAAKDPYSTQRDSNAGSQAWRTHLSFSTVDKIQKQCADILRSAGYKDFKTKKDLLNLNISATL